MTVRVVDALEMIEVKKNERDLLIVAIGELRFSIEAILKISVVEQSGQRVGHRLCLNLTKQACVAYGDRELVGNRLDHQDFFVFPNAKRGVVLDQQDAYDGVTV